MLLSLNGPTWHKAEKRTFFPRRTLESTDRAPPSKGPELREECGRPATSNKKIWTRLTAKKGNFTPLYSRTHSVYTLEKYTILALQSSNMKGIVYRVTRWVEFGTARAQIQFLFFDCCGAVQNGYDKS
jgi:hypothetical protein